MLQRCPVKTYEYAYVGVEYLRNKRRLRRSVLPRLECCLVCVCSKPSFLLSLACVCTGVSACATAGLIFSPWGCAHFSCVCLSKSLCLLEALTANPPLLFLLQAKLFHCWINTFFLHNAPSFEPEGPGHVEVVRPVHHSAKGEDTPCPLHAFVLTLSRSELDSVNKEIASADLEVS